MSRVVVFLGTLMALGFVVTGGYAIGEVGGRFGGALVWALALTVLGTAIGFLFGIPRVLQQERGPTQPLPSGQTPPPAAPDRDPRSYQQRVNTNLEEISDWLTKIIVGLGLVNLKTVPEYLSSLGKTIAPSLGEPAGATLSAATAMAVFYPVVGFLFGYLVTRLYVQGAFARADLRAQAEKVSPDEVSTAASETRQELAAAAPPEPSGPTDEKKGLRELDQVIEEYFSLQIADFGKRVRRKDELAREMYRILRANGISKDTLAKNSSEGYALALASYVLASPERGDVERLLNASAVASRLHIRYRIVLAFAALERMGLIAPSDVPRIRMVLDQFRGTADAALLRQISSLQELLNKTWPGGAAEE